MSKQNTWLYKHVDIQNLAEIQNEFLAILNKYHSDWFSDSWTPNKFCDLSLETVMREATAYSDFIRKLGLHSRWHSSYFATVNSGNNNNNQWVVHVDDKDSNYLSYALNLPILNCEDSYTVWYDVKPDSEKIGWVKHYENVPCFLPEDIIKEIGRMPATQSAFVNISIPHRPEVMHNNPRIVLTTRFKPELHDYDFDRLEFTIDR